MKRSRAGSGSRWRSQRVRLLSGFNWVETSLVETTSRRAPKKQYGFIYLIHHTAPHYFCVDGSTTLLHIFVPFFSHWGTKAELLWGSELIAKRSRGDVSFCDAGSTFWETRLHNVRKINCWFHFLIYIFYHQNSWVIFCWFHNFLVHVFRFW